MILFNGQEFPSMKAFKRAFPIYASYADAVRDGADTVLKLETVINQRRTNVRESQKTGHAHLREIHKGDSGMGQVDTFGDYVRRELDHWGQEFALRRDFEYLGHCSKNMLQVLIDHRGEMPPPNTGYKPLETDLRAQRIEDVVADIARDQLPIACVLRAYYCGSGRRKVERLETANLLLATAGQKVVKLRHYMVLHDLGLQTVRGALIGFARAA